MPAGGAPLRPPLDVAGHVGDAGRGVLETETHMAVPTRDGDAGLGLGRVEGPLYTPVTKPTNAAVVEERVGTRLGVDDGREIPTAPPPLIQDRLGERPPRPPRLVGSRRPSPPPVQVDADGGAATGAVANNPGADEGHAAPRPTGLETVLVPACRRVGTFVVLGNVLQDATVRPALAVPTGDLLALVDPATEAGLPDDVAVALHQVPVTDGLVAGVLGRLATGRAGRPSPRGRVLRHPGRPNLSLSMIFL